MSHCGKPQCDSFLFTVLLTVERLVKIGVADVREDALVVLLHAAVVEGVPVALALVLVVLVPGRVRMLVKLRVADVLACVKIPIAPPNVMVALEVALVVPVRKKVVVDAEGAVESATTLV